MPIPLLVKKKLTVMVKPSKHVDQQTLSLSTLDNDPYNRFIVNACYVFKAKNGADDYDQPQSILMEALSDLLVYYYPLSGSLKRQKRDRKLKLSCGGDGSGVPFTVATANLDLSSLKLMTRPVWERERLVGVKIPPFVHNGDTAASPYLPTDDWVTEKVNIRADSIRKLKEATLKENDFSNESLTTFEVLGAYLWKSRVKALSLDRDGITLLGLSVGIRNVVDPPLPDGYYGNAYIDVFVTLTTKEVEDYSISEIVKLIKEAKRIAHDRGFLQEVLANTKQNIKINLTIKGKTDGVFCLTDWRNIGFFGSMDFGWNEPVNFVPVIQTETTTPPISSPAKIVPVVSSEIDRTVNIFMRPSRLESDMLGGVQIAVALPRMAMVKFRKEMKALE